MSEERKSVVAAVVQLCSTEDIAKNLHRCSTWITRAAEAGADVILLPENALFLALTSSTPHPKMTVNSEPVVAIAELARLHRCHILLGSISEESPTPGKTYNTSLWMDSNGRVTATYRKIHLFDIELTGRESHRESERTLAGEKLICADTEWLRFGLSVCYDLRFPELYRELVNLGAEALCVPAAFTSTTGRDHWEPLLRARAIENQCYVLAPGQWGHHGGKRRSHGRSMIVDPWGTIVAQASDGEGFALAQIKPDFISKVRRELPCLSHRRKLL